jgi:site-specific DNA-methyltransferase (adenine-specific)
MQFNIGSKIELYRDDCLKRLNALPQGSVDVVLCDLPYGGLTGCDWDVAIDLHAFWKLVRHILKPRGVIIAFAAQPFSSDLVSSNREWFRYSLVWEKSRPTGFLQCWQRPLTAHEDILIFTPGTFASGKHTAGTRAYFEPQGVTRLETPLKRKAEHRLRFLGKAILPGATQEWTNFPRSVLRYKSVHKPMHPTQKPVDLLSHLILSYCPEGGTVLDPTMGAGSTGVAAIAAGRRFIGIERDEGYFRIAVNRLDSQRAEAA